MIVLEHYQKRAVDYLAGRIRALIESPAGSGKTIIAAAALDRVIRARPRTRKVRVGWIANTIDQCDQGKKALALFPAITGNCECLVACPQGIPPQYECDVLIVDEAQHSPSPMWSAIINRHKGALWLFSATPFGDNHERNEVLRMMAENQVLTIPRSDVKNRVVHGIVQMIDATDDRLEGTADSMQVGIDKVIDQGLQVMVRKTLFMNRWKWWGQIHADFCADHRIKVGANPDLSWKTVDEAKLTKEAGAAIWKQGEKEMWPRVAYSVCLQLGIAKNRARNRKVIELADRHGEDSTLILIHSVTHGHMLADHIPGSIVCHSKMGVKKRRLAIQGFRDGTVRCLIATSLCDEGIDVPRANVLVMACGGKHAGRTEQRAGRVTRSFDEFKTHGLIYDFEDYQHPLLAKHSLHRQSVYRELGYELRTPGEVDFLPLPGLSV